MVYNEDRADMTIEEREQLDKEIMLSRDIELLVQDERFKRVILGAFIDEQLLEIGHRFTGSVEDVEKLKSIGYLKRWLNSAIISE
jgi:hypothetical protein